MVTATAHHVTRGGSPMAPTTATVFTAGWSKHSQYSNIWANHFVI